MNPVRKRLFEETKQLTRKTSGPQKRAWVASTTERASAARPRPRGWKRQVGG